MRNWSLTREPVQPRQNSTGLIETEEAFHEALDKGWDKVVKQYFTEPFQGEDFVRFRPVKRKYGKETAFRGLHGTVPMNRDADTMPYITSGMAFPWEWFTWNFRVVTGFEREAIELDEVGYTRDRQKELIDAHKRTVEYVIADHFNRGFGINGAPRLANDGMYYIDSDRPNPNADAPSWSNLEATADLEEDTLFMADYNASQQIGPDGTLFPTEIKKIMIGPAWKQKIWKVLNTERVLGSNHNDRNWASDAFSMDNVIIYKYLRTNAIYYWLADPKSSDNELVLLKRKDPNIVSGWGMIGGNPDVLAIRLRASWGMGLGDVRKSIRGGLLEDSELESS